MKLFKLIIISLAVFFFSPFSSNLYSAEMLVGIKVWYTTWNPYVKDMGKELAHEEGWEFIDGGTGMMYGPSAALMLTDRLSFSVSYLYGELNADYNAEFNYEDKGYSYSGNVETRRHDVDFAISYTIFGSFKFFAGFKYQPLQMKNTKKGGIWILDAGGNKTNSGVCVESSEIEFDQKNYAPGFGIGYSYGVSDFLVFTLNLSALYFWGTMQIDSKSVYYDVASWSSPQLNEFEFDADVSGYGINIEPGFVLIAGEKIFVQIGFRYQRVWIDLEADVPGADEKVTGLTDYLYGVYLSALYKI